MKRRKNGKRVLFLIQLPPPVHGASIMNRLVYRKISRNTDFSTDIVPLRFAKRLSDLQRVDPRKIWYALTVFFRIIVKAITFRPTIIYFSMVPLGKVLIRDATYLILLKILCPKAKKIVHLHRPGLGAFVKSHRKLIPFYRFLFRNCEIVHLTEQLARSELYPMKLVNTDITIIPNTVEEVEYPRCEHRNRNNLLFLANLLPHKGYLELIEAYALLKSRYPQLTLTIAGDSPSEEITRKIKDRIKRLNLTREISLYGFVEGKAKQELFNRASLLILPSRLEYFPLVILEAMQAKIPVICCNLQNLRGVFEHLINIYFIDTQKPSAIAEAIDFLLKHPDLADRIALNGYNRYVSLNNESLEKIDKLFKPSC